MDNQEKTFQDLLSRQIKIRNLQGRWRRVSSLTTDEIEELWNETAEEIGHKKLAMITGKVGANEDSVALPNTRTATNLYLTMRSMDKDG